MLSTTASGQCLGILVPSTYSCIESHARRRTRHLQTYENIFTAPLPAQAPRQQRFARLKLTHSRTMATGASKPASDDISFLKQVALEAAKTGAKVRSRFVEHPVLSFPLPFSMFVAQVVHEALEKPRNIHFKGVTDLVTDTDRASEEAILEASRTTWRSCRYAGCFANIQCPSRLSGSKCQIMAFLVRRVVSLEMLIPSFSGASTQLMAPLILLLDIQALVYL